MSSYFTTKTTKKKLYNKKKVLSPFHHKGVKHDSRPHKKKEIKLKFYLKINENENKVRQFIQSPYKVINSIYN